MSITMAEWEQEAKKLTKEEARKVYNAIQTLKNWEVFHKHYGWTGYTVIGIEVKNAHKLEV